MAVDDTHVFPGFLTSVLIQISFQSHRLLFSHNSAEVKGKNMPERNLHQPVSNSQPPGHESDTLSNWLSPEFSCVVRVNPLLNDKILALSKLEAFVVNNFNIFKVA